MSQFDLSAINGIKAKPTGKGQYRNRRFTESDVARIKRCVETNEGRRGVKTAIARRVGVTPSTIWWIVEGLAYK